ncbi:MAG: hypothetical protein DWQ05_22595 [Calditrichaeota bacterium]|nr:MAG: hypothetical protein DWQ05_22595 [Calditrichota bacterium]
MKNNYWLFSFILFISISITNAQELELSGYFENQFFPQKVGDQLVLQDYNKLRLDISAEVAENITFNANYVYRTFHGATTINPFDFLPAKFTAGLAALPLASFDEFNLQFTDENYLDNAFVTLYSDLVNLRIGKQQLPWGTGYSWNPTDIFNAKNTLDPTYEKVGINAFKMEYPFGDEGMLTAIVSPESEWGNSTKALKIKQHFLGFDFSASAVEKEQQTFIDVNTFGILFFDMFNEKRQLFGGDFSGELFGLGVWAEGAYNKMKISENYGQYLFGMDYTFESGLYFTSEYYRNELGKSNKNQYTFADWMRLFGADGENLGQDYLFAGQRYPISELWNWSNYALINLTDKSAIFFPWFDYSFNDNSEIMFVGYVPVGEKDSEFGEFGYGGIARVRVYF